LRKNAGRGDRRFLEMRKRRRRRLSLTGRRLSPVRGALLGALLLTPGVAAADAGKPPLPNHLGTNILLGLGAEPSWFARHIQLSFEDGVSYHEAFHWRSQNLKLKVWGPVLGSKPGLGMHLQGLRIGALPLELRAYGTQQRQGLRVDLHF